MFANTYKSATKKDLDDKSFLSIHIVQELIKVFFFISDAAVGFDIVLWICRGTRT